VKLVFVGGYQEICKDRPTRRIKIDIYLWHRLRKRREDTWKKAGPTRPRGQAVACGPGRQTMGPMGQPPLLTSVLHLLRVCIYAVVSSQFDLRALMHFMGLYKQSLHPLASNSVHKSQA
jgi:hypothetical protein